MKRTIVRRVLLALAVILGSMFIYQVARASANWFVIETKLSDPKCEDLGGCAWARFIHEPTGKIVEACCIEQDCEGIIPDEGQEYKQSQDDASILIATGEDKPPGLQRFKIIEEEPPPPTKVPTSTPTPSNTPTPTPTNTPTPTPTPTPTNTPTPTPTPTPTNTPTPTPTATNTPVPPPTDTPRPPTRTPEPRFGADPSVDIPSRTELLAQQGISLTETRKSSPFIGLFAFMAILGTAAGVRVWKRRK